MAEIKLARVDFRLMHGQVVTGWLNHVGANTILIIDDELFANQFLAQVFLMAAPPGVKCVIRSIEKAIVDYMGGKFGNRQVLVLFKSIESAYRSAMSGFPIAKVQIGGMDRTDDKRQIGDVLYISDDEIEMVKELSAKGIEVYFQVTTAHDPLSLEEALQMVK